MHAVGMLAKARLTARGDVEKLEAIKLVYGSGLRGTRGVTFFNRWKSGGVDSALQPFVEVSAFGQESWIQLAGTTIHELAHVLAGFEAGHGPDWKAACKRLGLNAAKAAGTAYCLASFAPDLRFAIAALPKPDEGEPVRDLGAIPGALPVSCRAGIGTRGGKSRGPGTGSRLRLWACQCGCKVRVASDEFTAIHVPCATSFKRVDPKPKP